MNVKIKQLRDLVVALDRADRNIEPMAPAAYQAAARKAIALTGEEMGLLPIADFAGPVSALQSMAENIYFGVNGCFADIDGTGRAPVARKATRALLQRLAAASSAPSQALTERLMTRLRSAAPDPAAARSAARSRRRPRSAAARARGDGVSR